MGIFGIVAFAIALVFWNTYAIEIEDRSGGDATIEEVGSLAFAKSAPNLTPEHYSLHLGGDGQFGTGEKASQAILYRSFSS